MGKLIQWLNGQFKDTSCYEITKVHLMYKSGFKPKPDINRTVYPNGGQPSFNQVMKRVVIQLKSK